MDVACCNADQNIGFIKFWKCMGFFGFFLIPKLLILHTSHKELLENNDLAI